MIHIDIKSSAVSTASATASPATVRSEQQRGIGWNSSTSRSTTPRASLSRRLCPTSRKRALPPSEAACSTTTASASQSPGDDRQRLFCYRAFDFRDACRISGSKHPHQNPTPQRPRKAERFTRQPSGNGPTPRPTPPRSARRELPSGCIDTNWHRPHAGINLKHQSADSNLSRTTC